jgi:thimet oligopeptidase
MMKINICYWSFHREGLQNLSWENFIEPLIKLREHEITNYLNLSYFDPKEEIRNELLEITKKYNELEIEFWSNREYFNFYQYYFLNSSNNLSSIQKRLLDKWMINFENSGIIFTNYKLIKDIKKELNELKNEFEINFSKNKVYYKDIKLNHINFTNLMKKTKEDDIRKSIYLTKYNSLEENIILLEKIIIKRKVLANALVFNNYADYRLKNRILRDGEKVENFLLSIKEDFNRKWQEEKKLINGDKLSDYNMIYYIEETKKRLYKDIFLFKKEETFNRILNIFEKIYDLIFIPLNVSSWHPSVKVYQVNNKYNLYFDLDYRDGKYDHFACFPLDKYSCALVGNFNNNLNLEDIETIFHELGHMIHYISNDNNYRDLSSFECEFEFVETPSQLMEYFVYNETILRILKPEITKEEINKIKSYQKLFNGYEYLRQLKLSLFDLRINQNPNIDIKKYYQKLSKEIIDIDYQETNYPAHFEHLVGEYEVGYYCYLWSRIYALKIFKIFEKKLNNFDDIKFIGKSFKNEILSIGASNDTLPLLEKWLNKHLISELD